MKKYYILLIFTLVTLSVHAQIVGEVSVTRKVLTQRNGQLHIELDILISPHAVTRSQSWTIIPELSTADRQSVKLFPHVLINGAYQQHMMERKRRLTGSYWVERQPYAVIPGNIDTQQIVRYSMDVPYEEWMANATLVLRQIQISPGDQRRVFTVDVNGAVDTDRN
ncbi:MAG: DUF3868 domain-containing protein [Alistipes sp.]